MDAIQNYVYRGQKPKPMSRASPGRATTPGGPRLDTIMENGAARQEQRSDWPLTQSSPVRNSQHGIPPLHSHEKPPPSYTSDEGEETKEPGRLQRMAQRRGGWKRLCLIISAILLVLIIALGVGLGVGLSQNSSSNSPAPTPSSTALPSGPFPIGAYAITAFLTNVSTACTSNPLTWSCYPYQLYSANPSRSETTFSWSIAKSPNSANSKPAQYVISAAPNPFDITFNNLRLALEDSGTESERYTFSLPFVKNVVPGVSISDDDSISSCFFNSTTLRASLYTRRKPTLKDGSGARTDSSNAVNDGNGEGGSYSNPWPGAVSIEQVASGGEDVPNCYRLEEGRAGGERVDLPPEGSGRQCRCSYMNYGGGGGGS